MLKKFNFSYNKVYKPTYTIYYYSSTNQYRIVYHNMRQSGFEDTKTHKNLKNACNSKSNIIRAKREIKEICLCNDFKYFVTLTINSKFADRFSLQQCQDLLHTTIRNYSKYLVRSGKSKLQYIIITEKHQNGAFHFHGLFSDLIPDDIYTNNNGYISSKYFSDKMGFCSFSTIRNRVRTAFYITKYITKNPLKNEKNQLYFCSKGLARADVSRVQLDEDTYTFDEKFFKFKNEFCKIRDFSPDDLTNQEKIIFLNLRGEK